jgi:hypothetical protein
VSALKAAGDVQQRTRPKGSNEVGQLVAPLGVVGLKPKNGARAIHDNAAALDG